MSKSKDKDVALACYAVVSGMFAMFTNPKNCGAKFTWGGFPEMMKDHCETDIFLYVASSNKSEDIRIRALAAKYGLEIATTLVNRMKA